MSSSRITESRCGSSSFRRTLNALTLAAAATAAVFTTASSSSVVGIAAANPFLEYELDNNLLPPDTKCTKDCFREFFDERMAREKANQLAALELAQSTAEHFAHNFRFSPDLSRLYHVTPKEDMDELAAMYKAEDVEAEEPSPEDDPLLADFVDDSRVSAADNKNDDEEVARKMAAQSATRVDRVLGAKRAKAKRNRKEKAVPSRRFLVPQSVITRAELEARDRKAQGLAEEPNPYTDPATKIPNGRSFFGATVWEGDSVTYDGVKGPNHADLFDDAGMHGDTAVGAKFESPFDKLRSLPVTTGECTKCSDSAFISTALAAEDACAEPLALLEKSAGIAGSDIETDMAWSAFCASDCFMKMSQIPLSHYCCLGSTAPAFLNILMACKTSTQPGHEKRYCGAEMSNMLVVGCNYTTESHCRANSKYCEWFSNTSSCLFRATTDNLEYVCTDCARSYFELFPAGGMYNYTVHAAMGGVYGAFCNRMQDDFCYMAPANMGYRMAQAADDGDYRSLCRRDPQSIRNRLCNRITAIRTSEAIRRRSLEQWKYCNASAAADQDCDYECAAGFLVGFAFEKTSMLMCSYDPTSQGGQICPRVVWEQKRRESCIKDVVENAFCPANCDFRIRNAAGRMGCCGPVYGQGAFDIANQAPYPTRFLIGATPVGLAYINNQSFEATPGETRPPRSNLEFTLIEERVERLTNANSFAPFANCSSFQIEFAFWTQNITKCVQIPAQRTYYIRLHLQYNNLQNCVNRDFVFSALKADIAAVTGISRPQIVQTYIAEDKETKVMMMGSRRVYSGVLLVLTVQSDADDVNQAMDSNILVAKSKGRFVFPTAGVEIMMNCPNVMPNTHTPIFVDMWPAPVAGNSPILKNAVAGRTGIISLAMAVLVAVVALALAH